MSKDVVELEMGEDGSYAPKGVKPKGKKNSSVDKNKYGHRSNEKPTIFKESHADEFLSGIDLGLDFIEKIVPRAERLLRLRG